MSLISTSRGLRTSVLLLPLCSLLFLSGCVSRNEADKKLAQVCQKAVEIFLPDYQKIKSVKKTEFSVPANPDDGDRHVVLHVVLDDNYLDENKTYSCNFYEHRGFLNTSYSADIAQIDMGDGTVYGRKDGEILGGFDNWQKVAKKIAPLLEN